MPSLDQAVYYDKFAPFRSLEWEDERTVDPPAGPSRSNLNNKLDHESQFMRRGKLAAWTPFYEDVATDKHARKRLSACVEQLLPAAAAEVGAEIPDNVAFAIQSRKRQKLDKELDDRYILPHLRSPSPPKSTEELAPMLALPQTYIDVMVSPAMRHALGEDTVEQGLQRTASELLEGEKPLMQTLGRMRDILRLRQRDVEPYIKPRWEAGRGKGADRLVHCQAGRYNTATGNRIPDLPIRHDTDNLWRVTQDVMAESKTNEVEYTVSDPRQIEEWSVQAPSGNTTMVPVHALFVVPEGITISAKNPVDPVAGSAAAHNAHYAQCQQYNIPHKLQVEAVEEALERLGELLSDCNEYKERLEEARDRVADVARVRKKVWNVVKARAGQELDKLEERDLQK